MKSTQTILAILSQLSQRVFLWANSHLTCERLPNALFAETEPVILANPSPNFKTQNGVNSVKKDYRRSKDLA